MAPELDKNWLANQEVWMRAEAAARAAQAAADAAKAAANAIKPKGPMSAAQALYFNLAQEGKQTVMSVVQVHANTIVSNAIANVTKKANVTQTAVQAQSLNATTNATKLAAKNTTQPAAAASKA